MLSRVDSSGAAGFLNLSEPMPDTDGSLTVAAFDATDTAPAGGVPAMHEPAPVNGIDDDGDGIIDNPGESSEDGVLARITVEAVGTGVSQLVVPGPSGGQDGFTDLLLLDGIGIDNFPGDPIPVQGLGVAAISVGQNCVVSTPLPTPIPSPAPLPTPTPTPTPSPAVGGNVELLSGPPGSPREAGGSRADGRDHAATIAGAVAAGALALAAGGWYARRRWGR